MTRRRPIELTPADWASLALLAEGPAHGFAIARALAPGGEVGRVWSSSRPLVYRGLSLLAQLGLIEERGLEQSDRGPRRTVLRATRAGRQQVDRWLTEPVPHVRELRSGLMLKLLFLTRRGADPSELLARQRAVLEPLAASLDDGSRSGEGFDRVLALWRLESVRAALRFLDDLAADPAGALSRAGATASPSP